MSRKLDWKWIAIGVLIMIGLNIAAGLVVGAFLGPEIGEAAEVEEVRLGGGQMAALAVVNFLVFVLGGYIVGVKSAGRTILEPGISAAAAVVIVLLLSGNLSLGNLLAGGLVPFLAGILGGWLGERRQQASGGV